MAKNSLSVEIAGRKISKTFYDWLAAEVVSSGIEANSKLDNFPEVRRRMGLGYENKENWIAEKQEDHLGRLENQWWPLFAEDPTDDEASAKVLFGSLMFVSGAYRFQSYLQAKNAKEYRDRRCKAVGINLQRTVTDHIATVLPASGNFSHADISIESYDGPSLKHSMEDVIAKVGATTIKNICSRVEGGLDLGAEQSPSVDQALAAQRGWVEFATDCVTLAAKIRRANLGAVPFLEPRSITVQSGEIHYPLDNPVDWSRVIGR